MPCSLRELVTAVAKSALHWYLHSRALQDSSHFQEPKRKNEVALDFFLVLNANYKRRSLKHGFVVVVVVLLFGECKKQLGGGVPVSDRTKVLFRAPNPSKVLKCNKYTKSRPSSATAAGFGRGRAWVRGHTGSALASRAPGWRRPSARRRAGPAPQGSRSSTSTASASTCAHAPSAVQSVLRMPSAA